MTTPTLTPELREKIEAAVAFAAGVPGHVLADAARLLLAFCPGDDGEKIDETFLKACGAVQEDNPDKWTLHRPDAMPVGIWRIDIGWKAVSMFSEYASSNLIRPISTRGQLRALCSALKIPLLPPGARSGGEG